MTEENLTQRERDLIERGRTAELVSSVKTAVREEVNNIVPNLVRDSVRDEVQRSMQAYFGHRAPEQILGVISETEKFHAKLSKMRETFWSRLGASVLKWVIWGFAMVVFYKFGPSALHHVSEIAAPNPVE